MRCALIVLSLIGAGLCAPQDDGCDRCGRRKRSAQTDTSGADILAAAENAQRYGGAQQQNSQPDVVDELFGVGGGSIVDESFEKPTSTVDNQSPTCSYYENDGYFCVPYYQCSGLGEIIVDGGDGLIDIRNGLELFPEDSKCEGYLEVCCRHPDWSGKPVLTKPPEIKKPYKAKCGRHNINGIGVRIQNDPYEASTQFAEWPHMCAMLEVVEVAQPDGSVAKKNNYVCGASLIEDNVVMTAAHCVDKLYDSVVKVRCGEWDTQQTVEPVDHQDRFVTKIISNPLFSRRNLTSNTALLLMDEPFILSAHIDTICLPSYEDAQFGYDWNHCVATGWGKDEFGADGKYQVILKQVGLNVVGHAECQSALRTVKRLGRFFRLDDTALCAGGEAGIDTCKGDGGSPLVCPLKGSSDTIIKNSGSGGNTYGDGVLDERHGTPIPDEDLKTYVQAGIVGWGIGCGMEGIPGVYTDVASQRCFIDWATRCLRGDQYIEPIFECQDWAINTRAQLRYALNSYTYQLGQIGSDSPRYKIIAGRVDAHRQQLDALNDLWRYCANDRGTLEWIEEDGGYGSQQPDLNSYVRIKEEGGVVGEADENVDLRSGYEEGQ